MRLAMPLVALCVLAASVAASGADYAPLRDQATGRLISLKLEGYRAGAGAAKSVMTPEAVSARAGEFVAAHAGLLGVSPAPQDLVALPARVDELGLGHQRFALRHGGLPVFGAEVLVHVADGAGVYFATVKPMGQAPATLTPVVSAAAARETALATTAASNPNASAIDAQPPALVILPRHLVGDRSGDESRLVWRVVVFGSDVPSSIAQSVFVDALTGDVLRTIALNRNADVPLNRAIYDCSCLGVQSGYCCKDRLYNGYFYGRDEGQPARGPSPSHVPPVAYGRPDTDLAYDLIYELDQYLMAEFGLDGPNNTGGVVVPGSGYPPDQTRVFVLTEPDTATVPSGWAQFAPTGAIGLGAGMAVADVVAHEYGHGVVFMPFTDENGIPIGAAYYGEVGALEEAWADIFGESGERHIDGLNDWLAGAHTAVGAVRNLMDPGAMQYSDATGALFPYPSRYHDPSFYCGTMDYAGVHENCTVPGHAFYLLAEGGSHNGCAVGAVGLDVAKQVFYRAWVTYFTSTATFNEAYFALQQAAADLYPPEIVDQVRVALQAVEMDQPGLCSGLPAVTPACANLSAVPDDLVSAAEGSSIRYCGPNPSFGPATVAYALARPGDVTVAVFDVGGRRVQTVVAERQDRGLHEATWSGRNVASGIYFIRVSLNGETVGTEKLLIIR